MDKSQLKHFVKSSECIANPQSTSKRTIPTPTLVSGLKIKEFYNTVVGKEAFQKQNKLKNEDYTSTKCLKLKSTKIPFNINVLMRAVESGKVKDVRMILEETPEGVNYKDQFHWTPLMSACCAGDMVMVEQLLHWKPDLSVRDKRGLNCRDLASMRGHNSIVDTIDRYLEDLEKPPVREECDSSKELIETSFYCEICKQNIENTTSKKHLSSTVHNFNSSSKHRMKTFYGIPESNKGFQILIKSGWDREGGLGPSGEGHKYPPKTVLKQDRTGLGAKKYKARVTHTLEDIKNKSKQIRTRKRDLKSEKRKGQIRDRELRRLLS